MELKNRVRNSTLSIRVAFGKSKAGMSFSTQEEFDEYTESGDGIMFSSSKDEPTSPFIRRVGAIMREDTHCSSTRINEMLQRIYTTESCKLYYGFLREHVTSFHRIIAAAGI